MGEVPPTDGLSMLNRYYLADDSVLKQQLCQPEQERYSRSPFLGVCRTFWMYGKVCLGPSVVVAYTNDGYLRDAYR
jgi:hypothetical protein